MIQVGDIHVRLGLSCDCRLPLADLTPTSHFILGNKLNIFYNTLSRRRCFLCPRKHSIRLGINGALFCAALGTASARLVADLRIYAALGCVGGCVGCMGGS